MAEFFQGWRRKVGCVALALACVVTTLWNRSWSTWDTIYFRPTQLKQICIESNFGTCSCAYQWVINGSLAELDVIERRSCPGLACDEGILPTVRRNNRWSIPFNANGDSIALDIPYSNLAVTQTLFSAYLILWKPRRRATRPADERAQMDGAEHA
jgi:hypothetical protein